MSNKTTEVLIKCPFYLTERGNVISCEGFVKNTCMTTRFPDSAMKKQHIQTHCAHEDGGECPMAKSLFAKYGMAGVRG